MISRVFPCLLLLGLTTLAAFADEAADVRRRMEQRLSAIDDLKSKQIIGENNGGFVEVRGSASAEQQGVVGDENRDREAVYGLIAKQTGASPGDVGRARAKKIAENSRPGLWLQRENGEWYKK